jgi:long-chain acyl-CoA synthetase
MLTMASALIRARRYFAKRPAMIESDGRERTWAGHCDEVARLAGALTGLGIEAGDRFAILAPNSVRQATLIHAGYWSGAVPVPINTRLAPAEIAQILDEAAPKGLWLSAAAWPLLESAELAAWRLQCILIDEMKGKSAQPTYSQLLSAAQPAAPAERDESDIAILLYTGGTTGRAKGVPLSHRNVVSNGLQVGLALSVHGGDSMLHVAPMFHSADLLGTAVTLSGGAHAYLAKPDPRGVVDAVKTLGITMTMVPPTLLQGMMVMNLLSNASLDTLRIFIAGGAPVRSELLREAQHRLPNGSMVQGYGLSETSPIISMMRYRHVETVHGEDATALRSVGKPVVGLDLRLVDDDGEDVDAGSPGEIIVRGPNVMNGYFKRPEATAAVFRNGWFLTGDVATVDGDGYLSIVDRKKDMIITGGENVYSVEVESVLLRHPAINEAAVIGVPDAHYGEAVCAVLVANPGAEIDRDEVIEFARRYIGGYKIPRRISVEKELPRSALGKILKNELRIRLAGRAE